MEHDASPRNRLNRFFYFQHLDGFQLTAIGADEGRQFGGSVRTVPLSAQTSSAPRSTRRKAHKSSYSFLITWPPPYLGESFPISVSEAGSVVSF